MDLTCHPWVLTIHTTKASVYWFLARQRGICIIFIHHSISLIVWIWCNKGLSGYKSALLPFDLIIISDYLDLICTVVEISC